MTTAPVTCQGETFLVYSYRLVPPRGGPAGHFDLTAEEYKAVLEGLRQRGWTDHNATYKLLPNVAELIVGDGSPGSGALTRLEQGGVKDGDVSGQLLKINRSLLRLVGQPHLLVYRTGIAHLVLRTQLVDELGVGAPISDLRKWAYALRHIVKYDRGSHGRIAFPACVGDSGVDGLSRTPVGRPAATDVRLAPGWQALHLAADLWSGPLLAAGSVNRIPFVRLAHQKMRPWEYLGRLFLTASLPSGWSFAPFWHTASGHSTASSRLTAGVLSRLMLDRSPTPAEEEACRQLLNKEVDLPLAEGDGHGRFRPSRNELCLAASHGAVWLAWHGVDEDAADRFFNDKVTLWSMVEHERQTLLFLAARTGRLSFDEDDVWAEIQRMRRALVDYTARYHFVTVSSEDRDERFHAFLASHFKINELAAEVRSEVTTLYDYVHGEEERRRREIQKELEIQHKEEERRNQERQDRMNHFLALLTVVFTPLGLWVGIFQDKTLPLELDGQAGRFVPFVGGIVLGVGLYVLARRWMRSPPPDADDPRRGADP